MEIRNKDIRGTCLGEGQNEREGENRDKFLSPNVSWKQSSLKARLLKTGNAVNECHQLGVRSLCALVMLPTWLLLHPVSCQTRKLKSKETKPEGDRIKIWIWVAPFLFYNEVTLSQNIEYPLKPYDIEQKPQRCWAPGCGHRCTLNR